MGILPKDIYNSLNKPSAKIYVSVCHMVCKQNNNDASIRLSAKWDSCAIRHMFYNILVSFSCTRYLCCCFCHIVINNNRWYVIIQWSQQQSSDVSWMSVCKFNKTKLVKLPSSRFLWHICLYNLHLPASYLVKLNLKIHPEVGSPQLYISYCAKSGHPSQGWSL